MANPLRGRIKNPELRDILKKQAFNRVIHMAPITADADWFDASQTLDADTDGTYVLTVLAAGMTNATCPGYPVVPVIVVTEDSTDSWTAVSIVVKGVDQFGDIISETVTATNSSGTWTGTAVNAYISLVSVVTTVTGTTSSADAQVIGFAKTIGLGCHIGATTDVLVKTFDGATDAGTVSAANHTYVIAGTPNNAKFLRLIIQPTAPA